MEAYVSGAEAEAAGGEDATINDGGGILASRGEERRNREVVAEVVAEVRPATR